MKKLLLFGMFFSSGFCNAQSNVVASGGDGESIEGSFSYSLGQIDYAYLEGSGGSASSGVQQSYELLTSVLDELVSVSFKTYPNPTYDFMIISMSQEYNTDYSIAIRDGAGSFIEKYEFHDKEVKIPLAHLSAGTYLIELRNADKVMGQEKIIKH